MRGVSTRIKEPWHERAVIDIGIGRQRREDDDEGETHDAAASHGTVAHIRLNLYLQVFANQSETVEEAELRDMLQGTFFLLGYLLIDILELEIAVDEEKQYNHGKQDRQQPAATSAEGIEIEQFTKGMRIKLQ